MSRAPLPAGYHDADSAAELLGISKRQLLARMRELGWLYVRGDQHNLPRHELKRTGLLSTQERAHCLKGKKEIVKTYQVMLLSQAGFQEIKRIMNTSTNQAPEEHIPTPKALPPANKYQAETNVHHAIFDRESSDKERAKCLDQLRDWGLAS